MSRATYLVTVSGPDRIGVGAELFEALNAMKGDGLHLMDVAQITIRGTLVLCAEVSAEGAITRDDLVAALGERSIEGEGMTAHVELVTPQEEIKGRRLLVTMLAPSISADQLGSVFHAIAQSEATCERIVHLASYPVDCYELIVLPRSRGATRSVDRRREVERPRPRGPARGPSPTREAPGGDGRRLDVAPR